MSMRRDAGIQVLGLSFDFLGSVYPQYIHINCHLGLSTCMTILDYPNVECSRMFQKACRMFQKACRMFQNACKMFQNVCRMFQNARKMFQNACRMFQNACRMFQNACRRFQNVPKCMQIYEIACRSMSLHAVT